MTKNEFRKEFTRHFDYIYIRTKASKGGKTKLGHSKFFTEGSEVSVDGNLTVAEFEKEATAKSGMEVSVYYETKPEDKRFKYYQANKEDAKTTLSSLDTRVADMDNIVAQKEYFKDLVLDKSKSIENEDINSAGTIIGWGVYQEEQSFESFEWDHTKLIEFVMEKLKISYGLINTKMTSPDDRSKYIPYNANTKLFGEEYDVIDSVKYIFELKEDNVQINWIAENLLFFLQEKFGAPGDTYYFVENLKEEEELWIYGNDEDAGDFCHNYTGFKKVIGG